METEEKGKHTKNAEPPRLRLTLSSKAVHTLEAVSVEIAKMAKSHSIGLRVSGPVRLPVETLKKKKGDGDAAKEITFKIHRRLIDFYSSSEDAEDVLEGIINDNIEPGIRAELK